VIGSLLLTTGQNANAASILCHGFRKPSGGLHGLITAHASPRERDLRLMDRNSDAAEPFGVDLPAAEQRCHTSVIVCSRNRPTLVQDAVESVLDGDQLPDEIVVIDQSDEPHPVLHHAAGRAGCVIRYRHHASRGASAARNVGAEVAAGDCLFFIDDDMFVASGWFRALSTALVRVDPETVVTGQVAPAERVNRAPSIKVDPVPAVYRGRTASDVLYTGNTAMRRALFAALGGFDERLGPGTAFPAAEDNDFGFRVLESGRSIVYAPEAIAYHRDWRTPREHLSLQWAYGRGQGAFYAKHLSTADLFMFRRALHDVARGLWSVLRLIMIRPAGAASELARVAGIVLGAASWTWHEHDGARRATERTSRDHT